jgi:hypothetical protein
MKTFNLPDFKNGKPVKTKKSGYVAKFIAILPDVPAPLVVDIFDTMENYYLDGSFYGADNESDKDLIMVDLP